MRVCYACLCISISCHWVFVHFASSYFFFSSSPLFSRHIFHHIGHMYWFPCAILFALLLLLLLHSRLCHHNNLMYVFLWLQLDSSLSFVSYLSRKKREKNGPNRLLLKRRIHLLTRLWPYDFDRQTHAMPNDWFNQSDPHAKWLLEF